MLACATRSRVERVAAEIREGTGNGAVTVGALDLSDLSSVGAFVAAWSGRLDILVNNAGVMAIQELTLSSSGHEMQFATNHLGHFGARARAPRFTCRGRLRTHRLGELRRAPALAGGVRRHRLRLPRLRPVRRLRSVKDRHVLFAVEATRRWASEGIFVNTLMPGGIATPLQRHLPAHYAEQALEAFRAGGTDFKSVEQGARHRCCCGFPLLDGIGGRYFEDCNEAVVVNGRGGPGGVASRRMLSTRPMPNGCGTLVEFGG